METWQIVLLAVIQGLTEFLPISSSAHLILPAQLLEFPDQGLAFDIAVHLGSLAAVLIYFRSELNELARACIDSCFRRVRSPAGDLVWFLGLSTLPVCLAALVVGPLVETHLRSIGVIAFTTIVFALALAFADKTGSRRRSLGEMSLGSALVVGLAQVLALVPGTSRSGITMTAALALGFERREAARYSFLLAIPVILLSGGYKLLEVGGEPIPDWRDLALGAVLSGITAFLCIHFFLALINRVGMMPFVYYRLALGVFLLLFLSNGVSVNA